MQTVDALFISYYEDIDRWHNDGLGQDDRPTGFRTPRVEQGQPGFNTLPARMSRQSVGIDGRLHDLARFLSWTRYGHTREYRRYDAFSSTHLSGTYVESLCTRHGFRVKHLNHASRLDLVEVAREFAPRWLFLSSTFLNETTFLFDAVGHLRRLWPGVPVVVGGMVLVELEDSVDEVQFQRFLQAWGADAYVVSPRADAQILQLLASEPADLARLDLAKTWVKRDGRWAWNEGHEVETPIDEAWVRWSRVDPAGIYHLVNSRTARSCAFSCSFCSFFVNQGKLTVASPATLERELCELRDLGSVRSIIFVDDTFNVPRGRFRELLDVLQRFDFEWYSFFRAQYADEELAARMADSGCRGVLLGIESLDERVLANMNKAATREVYAKGVTQLSRAGVACHANFLVGFPGDRPEYQRQNIEFCDEHGVRFFNVSPWYCSPVTPVYKDGARYSLEGKYFQWRHTTMDSTQAFQAEDQAIQAGQSAVFISEIAAQSAWTEFLLYANGVTPDEAQELVRFYDRLCGRDWTSEAIREAPEFGRVRSILFAKDFPAPPGSELLAARLAPAAALA